MTSFGTVRIAAIQATPVILDAEASIDKALGLLREAARDLREGLRAKRWFDAVGHYSREDLFVSEQPDEPPPQGDVP